MANEMRDRLVELLSEADAKCTNTVFCNECSAYGKGRDCIDYNIADHLIENGVVPVVRCKDCKYYKAQKQSVNWKNKKKYCCRVVALKVNENDYCSYGERKCE